MVTDPPVRSPETEGDIREKLAAYFLSAPPLERQDTEQKRRHKEALRRLLQLENRSILQAAGMPRPLSQGDLAALLRALLDACLQTLGAARQRDGAVPLMTLRIVEGFPQRETAGFEPRLIQASVVGLLRAACKANPADLVAVSLSAGLESFILTVTGENPPAEAEALAVAKETARLHKAVCSGTVGLSLSTSLPGDAGLYVAPTPTQLLRDSLSAVQVGLYSSLG